MSITRAHNTTTFQGSWVGPNGCGGNVPMLCVFNDSPPRHTFPHSLPACGLWRRANGAETRADCLTKWVQRVEMDPGLSNWARSIRMHWNVGTVWMFNMGSPRIAAPRPIGGTRA